MVYKNLRFKKGAASFYIVAFSTLILLIVATSFATVIISEIERTSNDDLSQSAYDSALAGVEDAKLAFYNYQNCLAQGSTGTDCTYIINTMKSDDCYMVGKILGRGDGEVVIKESAADNGGNNMQQAYTCVKIKTTLDNYKSTLSSTTQTKTVKLKFADGVNANSISKVKVSWYADEDASSYKYTNFNYIKTGATFPSANTALAATPPTIAVGLVQTGTTFDLSSFDTSRGESQTNRGMVYLVPTNDQASATDNGNNQIQTRSSGMFDYRRAYYNGENQIKSKGMIWSNDKTVANRNLPYAVYCGQTGKDFACSATIELPKPIGGMRSNDTFLLTVSLPYGKPTTSFMLEFEGAEHSITYLNESGETVTERTTKARLDGVQIEVDSTGRANDLYRRVETRLESAGNDGNLVTMGPLELTGNSGSGSGSGGSGSSSALLNKQLVVKCEYNFAATCP